MEPGSWFTSWSRGIRTGAATGPAAAFVLRLAYPATIIAATVYLAYGLSRLLSIALDGLPAAALEMVLGIINAGLLVRW